MSRLPVPFSTLALVVGLALPTAASAQSNLGIIGAELRLGLSSQTFEGGFVGGIVDVAITNHHGAQFDLQYEERSTGGVGRLGTTIYMTPRNGQKYGLTAMVADKNDVSATYGQLGAAGIFELAPKWHGEVRAGGGLSADNDLDWITAGAGLHWQATGNTRLYGRYDIASFDEQSFSARAHDVTIGVQSQLNNSPFGVFAEATHDWLSGRDAADGDTTVRGGLSLSLGQTGNGQPAFHLSDPLRQILRRGLF